MIHHINQSGTRIHKLRGYRRGATLVEAAIALGVVCTIIIGFLDFTIAAFRSQVLNHVAHRVARSAVIHGSFAPDQWSGGKWGPSGTITSLGADDPIAQVAQTLSSGLRGSDVVIELTWPDGTNTPGSPVQVETRMDWAPMFIERFGYGIITLRGRSSQIIQH
jgi:hypothetical protein